MHLLWFTLLFSFPHLSRGQSSSRTPTPSYTPCAAPVAPRTFSQYLPGTAAVPQGTLLGDSVGNAYMGGTQSVGRSLAVSADGSVVVVTAYSRAVAGLTSAGIAYIYSRSLGSANWTQVQNLTAPTPMTSGSFGTCAAVSSDGSTIAISSYQAVVVRGTGGSVTIFSKDQAAQRWNFTIELVPPPSQSPLGGWLFGLSLSLSADGLKLAVGAQGYSGNTGAAYIFNRSSSGLTPFSPTAQVLLSTAAPGMNQYFGAQVSLSGDGLYLAVGVPGKDFGGTFSYGMVVMYTYDTDSASYVNVTAGWQVLSSDLAANDRFGFSVALDGTGSTLAVGSPYKTTPTVYTFARTGSGVLASWKQTALITAGATSLFSRTLGLSSDGLLLAISQDMILYGAIFSYRFTCGTQWVQQQTVMASDTASISYFGRPMALAANGNVLLGSNYGRTGGGGFYIFSADESLFYGPSSSPTPLASLSVTVSPSTVASFTPTATMSIPPLISPSPSPSGSATTISSTSPSSTTSPLTLTASPSQSTSASAVLPTPSSTASSSISAASTPSLTLSATASISTSRTASSTPSLTRSMDATPSQSQSNDASPSVTRSLGASMDPSPSTSSIATVSPSSSWSETYSPTASVTSAVSLSTSSSSAVSPSTSPLATPSPSAVASLSTSPSLMPSSSASSSKGSIASVSPTMSVSLLPSPSSVASSTTTTTTTTASPSKGFPTQLQNSSTSSSPSPAFLTAPPVSPSASANLSLGYSNGTITSGTGNSSTTGSSPLGEVSSSSTLAFSSASLPTTALAAIGAICTLLIIAAAAIACVCCLRSVREKRRSEAARSVARSLARGRAASNALVALLPPDAFAAALREEGLSGIAAAADSDDDDDDDDDNNEYGSGSRGFEAPSLGLVAPTLSGARAVEAAQAVRRVATLQRRMERSQRSLFKDAFEISSKEAISSSIKEALETSMDASTPAPPPAAATVGGRGSTATSAPSNDGDLVSSAMTDANNDEAAISGEALKAMAALKRLPASVTDGIVQVIMGAAASIIASPPLPSGRSVAATSAAEALPPPSFYEAITQRAMADLLVLGEEAEILEAEILEGGATPGDAGLGELGEVAVAGGGGSSTQEAVRLHREKGGGATRGTITTTVRVHPSSDRRQLAKLESSDRRAMAASIAALLKTASKGQVQALLRVTVEESTKVMAGVVLDSVTERDAAVLAMSTAGALTKEEIEEVVMESLPPSPSGDGDEKGATAPPGGRATTALLLCDVTHWSCMGSLLKYFDLVSQPFECFFCLGTGPQRSNLRKKQQQDRRRLSSASFFYHDKLEKKPGDGSGPTNQSPVVPTTDGLAPSKPSPSPVTSTASSLLGDFLAARAGASSSTPSSWVSPLKEGAGGGSGNRGSPVCQVPSSRKPSPYSTRQIMERVLKVKTLAALDREREHIQNGGSGDSLNPMHTKRSASAKKVVAPMDIHSTLPAAGGAAAGGGSPNAFRDSIAVFAPTRIRSLFSSAGDPAQEEHAHHAAGVELSGHDSPLLKLQVKKNLLVSTAVSPPPPKPAAQASPSRLGGGAKLLPPKPADPRPTTSSLGSPRQQRVSNHVVSRDSIFNSAADSEEFSSVNPLQQG